MDPYKNILIINLQKRTDRLINVYKELDSINLSNVIIRIKAMDSEDAYNYIDKLSDNVFSNIIDINDTCMIPNLSALGCALSHMKCWKYMIDNNLYDGLIVEDDIMITDPHFFNFDLCNIKNHIKNDMKMLNERPIFLAINPKINNDINYISNYYDYRYGYGSGYGSGYGQSYNNNIVKNKVSCLTKPFTGTHFYYINIHMAQYLLENITKLTYQIDIEIGLLAQREKFNNMFYAYYTDNLKICDFGSDIQTYIIDLIYLEKCLRDIRNVPETVTNIIYTYLPDIFRQNR